MRHCPRKVITVKELHYGANIKSKFGFYFPAEITAATTLTLTWSATVYIINVKVVVKLHWVEVNYRCL